MGGFRVRWDGWSACPPRNHKVDDFVCAFGGVVWGWGLHALEVRHLWFWGRAFILFSGGGVYGFEFEGRAFMGFVGVLMVFEGGVYGFFGGGGCLWFLGQFMALVCWREGGFDPLPLRRGGWGVGGFRVRWDGWSVPFRGALGRS